MKKLPWYIVDDEYEVNGSATVRRKPLQDRLMSMWWRAFRMGAAVGAFPFIVLLLTGHLELA